MPDVLLPASALGRVHLVGIGGAALSGIARLLLARGATVSGSDAQDSPVLASLSALGARVVVGHDAGHLDELGADDTVVVSTAVRADNPEVVEATRRGLRMLPRSAALAALMHGRRVLAVAGTHGKTTTTSMLTVALRAAGADPTYAVGGDLADTGTNAHEGADDLFVAEADESDGAFLVYSPYAAVVTTLDADHLDVWGSEQAYRAAFEEFVAGVDRAGFLVAGTGDPEVRALAGGAAARGLEVLTVSDAADADLRVDEVRLGPDGTRARLRWDGAALPDLRLAVPGSHYAVDAGLALAAGLRLGLDAEPLLSGLAGFSGTSRRMQWRGAAAGVRVYDSYAHHPVEITGDLEAARALTGGGRLVVCFQPHLVSRTRLFGPAMGEALGAADVVVVLDVYLAREEPEPGVDGGLVAAAVPLPAALVHRAGRAADAPALLAGVVRPGDLVLTLGAGDVTTVGPLLLALLAGAAGSGEEPVGA